MKHQMHALDHKAKIWVIGESLLMDGIAASFEERKIGKPVRWPVLEPETLDRLSLSLPGLIIFELDTPGASRLLDMLKEHPGIQLLGVDRECARVILLNSEQRPTQTMEDLIQIVQEAAGFREKIQEGGN